MSRRTDEARREEARRLFALNIPTARIAAQLGVERRTVQRWVGVQGTPRGARKRPDVPDEKIRALMDEGLSYAAAGRRLGVPWTTVRNRWYAINGAPGRSARTQPSPGVSR